MLKIQQLSPRGWVFISLCIGVFLRFHQYSLNRSLWIDEAFVAINLLNRSYAQLLQPLDYNQGAPFGFLAIERLSLDLFGTEEWVLRLFPFVSSIVALLLCVRVAGYFCDRLGLVVSLGLLALCDRAIYYGSELKQYSSDLMIALLLYVCLIEILPKPVTKQVSWWRYLLFAGAGAIAVWISHPSVFVIAGTGLWLLGEAGLARQWSKFVKYAATFAVPALSFIAFYIISISKLVDNDALQQSWSTNHNSFMPLPPTNLNDLKQMDGRVWALFSYAYDRRSPLDEEDAFVCLLNREGTQLDAFRSVEASTYLYNFEG